MVMHVEYGPICRMETQVLEQVTRRAEEIVREKYGVRVQLGGERGLFPFLPEEVEGVFVKKSGPGPGLLFRLRDGRLFDPYGQPAVHPGGVRT